MKLEQYLNSEFPIEVTFSGIVTVFKLEQFKTSRVETYSEIMIIGLAFTDGRLKYWPILYTITSDYQKMLHRFTKLFLVKFDFFFEFTF